MDFNSIKVRLEPFEYNYDNLNDMDFNSIKVRLEPSQSWRYVSKYPISIP